MCIIYVSIYVSMYVLRMHYVSIPVFMSKWGVSKLQYLQIVEGLALAQPFIAFNLPGSMMFFHEAMVLQPFQERFFLLFIEGN